MKNGTKRWLYLLAGSALSAKEIKDMCVWLANDAPDDIVASVMQLRRQELTLWPVAEGEARAAASRGRPANADADYDVAAEIVFILRTESHLTAREAAERLAAELESEMRLGSEGDDVTCNIPAYSKESFRAYVGKLLKHTSPQMLLHLAHRIRDSVVERQTSAWPLRASAS